MQKITPFLWFDTQAEEAVNFYTSVFKNSKIGKTARYDEAGAKASGRPAGSVMTTSFQLQGQEFVALNGGPIFKLNPSISFFANSKDESEVVSCMKNFLKEEQCLCHSINILLAISMHGYRTSTVYHGN